MDANARTEYIRNEAARQTCLCGWWWFLALQLVKSSLFSLAQVRVTLRAQLNWRAGFLRARIDVEHH